MEATADPCGKDGPCDGQFVCFKHKIRSIQWSPSATPSRRNTIAPRTPNNSWEKGIARDERGMPLLGADGHQLGLKELANNRGGIESRIRELKNTPPVPNKEK